MKPRLFGPNPLRAMHVGDENFLRVVQRPQKAGSLP